MLIIYVAIIDVTLAELEYFPQDATIWEEGPARLWLRAVILVYHHHHNTYNTKRRYLPSLVTFNLHGKQKGPRNKTTHSEKFKKKNSYWVLNLVLTPTLQGIYFICTGDAGRMMSCHLHGTFDYNWSKLGTSVVSKHLWFSPWTMLEFSFDFCTGY